MATNEDIESQPAPISVPASDKQPPRSVKIIVLALIAICGLIWGSVMTALYVNEIRNGNLGTEALKAVSPDTVPRSNGPLGIHALSHVNVVVNDSVDSGAEYYQMLGFNPASNADGPMKYLNVTNHGFCVDAGFESCRVDILFLKHEIINLYLELFFYYEPVGDRKIPIFNTNDAGGIRHIAVEVVDAVQTYEDLKAKDHQGTVRHFLCPRLLSL